MRMFTQALALSFTLTIAVCAARPTPAQQPKLNHSQASVFSGDLQKAVASTNEPTWIGYSEPTIRPMRNSWDDGVQYLEGHLHEVDDHTVQNNSTNESMRMIVLLRVLGGRVSKVSMADPERTLDVGGLPFVWVNDVSQTKSLQALSAIADAGIVATPAPGTERIKSPVSGRSVADGALLAISLHSAPESTASLRAFTAERYPAWTREKAAFWLAVSRPDGYDALKALLQTEHDDALRSKLVFDLTLIKGSSHAAAVDQLITLARNDASPKVRKDAQFWLAQGVKKNMAADPRVAETLRGAAENDPEASIRKSAVFALSRLPSEQAATELIRIASSTKDPVAKREAVFWLGQSKDSHALDYLEKLAKE